MTVWIRGLALALIAALALPATVGAAGAEFATPAVRAGEDGWELYVGTVTIDRENASALSPAPTSPEAAVVLFLASRIRGDDDWQAAMVAEPSGRAERKLEAWAKWRLNRAELLARKTKSPSSAYVRVRMRISVGDDEEEGSDEFEVVRENGGWRISMPPS